MASWMKKTYDAGKQAVTSMLEGVKLTGMLLPTTGVSDIRGEGSEMVREQKGDERRRSGRSEGCRRSAKDLPISQLPSSV